MEEIWKNVKGYEGLYQVSNYGRIKSLGRYITRNRYGKTYRTWQKENIKTPTKNNKGYFTIKLSKDNIDYSPKIHRLVAITFELPLPEHLKWHDYDELEVNHKDEDKSNNRIDNLEWCTHDYNCNYGTRNERHSLYMTNNKLFSKTVLQYTKDGQFIAEYPSMMEASRKTGINNSCICMCCSGKRNSTGGFIWKYKNEGN